MLLKKSRLFTKSLSTSTTSLYWRDQIKQNQLVSQISSLLLQRHNWVPLLRPLGLSSKLTPPLLVQILHKTQTNPQVSLNFFNWAQNSIGFKPDIKCRCHLIRILIESGLFRPAKLIFDSLVETNPPSVIVDSVIIACKEGRQKSISLVFLCIYASEWALPKSVYLVNYSSASLQKWENRKNCKIIRLWYL